jgi:hypothetical protein
MQEPVVPVNAEFQMKLICYRRLMVRLSMMHGNLILAIRIANTHYATLICCES